MHLPRFLIGLYAWFHHLILLDATYASLVQGWHVKDSQEYYTLVGQREDYRAEWFDYWQRGRPAGIHSCSMSWVSCPLYFSYLYSPLSVWG